MSYYGCDQVQVQCVPSIHSDEEEKSNSKEVYSKPIECNNLSNHSLINVTIDTTKFSPCNPSQEGYITDDGSYFICLIVKNVTTKTKADENNQEKTGDHYVPSSVVPGCVSLSLPGPYSNLSAIFEAETRSLEVKFSSNIKRSTQENYGECKTHIQILDMTESRNNYGASTVKKATIACDISEFDFNGVQYGGQEGENLAFCVWQEIDHVQTSEKQCTKSMQKSHSNQNKNIENKNSVLHQTNGSNRKLPLILTLVFLCVGIIGLVILHNVVKGYLSDRRGAALVPSFLCSLEQMRNRSWRNRAGRRPHYSYKTAHVFPFQQDENHSTADRGTVSWFNNIRCWFSRKLRFRRHHHSVDGDEAALEDEFCTEMSFVT